MGAREAENELLDMLLELLDPLTVEMYKSAKAGQAGVL